jgi:hypothetical protein
MILPTTTMNREITIHKIITINELTGMARKLYNQPNGIITNLIALTY